MKKIVFLLLMMTSALCAGQTADQPKGQALTPRQENIMRALINADVEDWKRGEHEHFTFLKYARDLKSEAAVHTAAEKLARFTRDLARYGLSDPRVQENLEAYQVGDYNWLLFSTVMSSYFTADTFCQAYDDECRQRAIRDEMFDEGPARGDRDERTQERKAMQMLRNIGYPDEAFCFGN